MRGRVAAGLDTLGGTPANRLTAAVSGVDGSTMGASGGSQSVTLAAIHIPLHTHSGTTGLENTTHTHTYPDRTASASIQTPNSGGSFYNDVWIGRGNVPTSTPNAPHNHNFMTDGGTGSGLAHANVQPTLVCNMIIKAH